MGHDIRRVDAVIVSHDHRDHIACAGVYHRKFKLPIYISPPTLQKAQDRVGLGKIGEVNSFCSGDDIKIGPLKVHTIPTPHDAADGVAFVIDDGRRRLGILTDLGHVFAGLGEVIASLDAVFLESNYDPQMLADGPYPWHLQQRITGKHGHLSNLEAAEVAGKCGLARLQWACLSHLSEQNNHPDIALQTHSGSPWRQAAAARRQPIRGQRRV